MDLLGCRHTEQVHTFHRGLPGYAPHPLWLPLAGRRPGCRVWVKD